jgi:hypothetical protein
MTYGYFAKMGGRDLEEMRKQLEKDPEDFIININSLFGALMGALKDTLVEAGHIPADVNPHIWIEQESGPSHNPFKQEKS